MQAKLLPAAPTSKTTNNAPKIGKNGKPPLLTSASYAFKDSGGEALHFGTVINSLKTCPPHQMPQTSTDTIKSPEASLCLIPASSGKQIYFRSLAKRHNARHHPPRTQPRNHPSLAHEGNAIRGRVH